MLSYTCVECKNTTALIYKDKDKDLVTECLACEHIELVSENEKLHVNPQQESGMTKKQFVSLAENAPTHFLLRFCDITKEELEAQIMSGFLADAISDSYDQMPNEERITFQNELLLLHDN